MEVVASPVARRDLLIVTVAGGLAAALGTTSTAAASPGSVVKVADVLSAGHDTLQVSASGEVFDVVAEPMARLYSGARGEVADLSHFVPGDRVVLEGRFAGKTFNASSVGSLFKTMSGTIEAVSSDGSVASSSLGVIALTGGRLPFSPTESNHPRKGSKVKPGDKISGLFWVDPSSHQRYLLIRGV